MSTELRPMCDKCPWRDPTTVDDVVPGVLAHAARHPEGFVCHTRMGPCDGPLVMRRQIARLVGA